MALALDGYALPAIKIIVSCSKGTYIRTLGEDIGAALGCGAHLTLRRIDTGGLGIERCVTVADLEAMDEAQRLSCLLPPEALLVDHTKITLGSEDASRFYRVCAAVVLGPMPQQLPCLAPNRLPFWAWATR